MRTSRVRRSNPKAAIGFWDCEVGSTMFLTLTTRSRRQKRERNAPRLPLQKGTNHLIGSFFVKKLTAE